MRDSTFVEKLDYRTAELPIPHNVPLVTPDETARLVESDRYAQAREYAAAVRERHGIR